MVFSSLETKSDGSAIINESQLGAAQALGEQQRDAVFFQASINGTPYTASGGLIRGEFADWVVLAAHLVKGTNFLIDTATMTVGEGPNYLNNRGLTSGVAEMIIPSVWDPASSKATEDWAFLRLTDRIAPDDLFFKLGQQPVFGQEMLLTSYSPPVSIATGTTLPGTGNVMSVTGVYSPSQPAGWGYLYDSVQRNPSDVRSGFEVPGGSGGLAKSWNPVTLQYESAGLIVAGNNTSQTTFFLSYNAPGVADKLYEITRPVPEPTTALLSMAGFAYLAGRRRRSS